MIADRKLFLAHAFEYACALNNVDHGLTKPKHPWTNGQVERMNRTIKDANICGLDFEAYATRTFALNNTYVRIDLSMPKSSKRDRILQADL